MVLTRFADAHLHMAEQDFDAVYPDISKAEILLTCAAQYRDWNIQSGIEDSRVIRFYGIHPWYPDQWSQDVSDELRSYLEKYPDSHVGEIGLDNKHPDPGLQTSVFTEQVKIADELGRCVNIHNQGCDGDIVRILRKNGRNCRSIILHSFKGPDVKQYSGLDCYFSVNPRILGKAPDKVAGILKNIPEDRLLIETDAPFFAPRYNGMESFIGTLAQLMGRTTEELSNITIENTRRAVQ